MHLDLVTVVSFLVAFVAQGSRLFVGSRPFWSKLPGSVQVLLPPLVPALAALGQGLGGVKSWTDLAVVFMGCAALMLPGLPSNRSAAPLEAGKPPTLTPSAGDVAVSAQVVRLASIAPKRGDDGPDDPTLPPPSALPVIGFLLFATFALHASACGPRKPPCDQARMAVIVTECTARSQDCVNKGIAKDQCPSLVDCDKQIEKACDQ